MRMALGLEYDGAPFHGWQSQADASGAQDAIERALSRIAAVVSSMNAAPLHFGSALHTLKRKFLRSWVPRSVWFTSGWNSTA